MKIENIIRRYASAKLTSLENKFRLPQYKEGGNKYEETLKAMTHKKICEEIVSFAESHADIPLYFILSVGVSKGAYKMSEFEKGYKHFDANKVEIIAEMCRLYNNHNGVPKRKASDVTIRLIMRYYELKGTDSFVNDLNKSKVLGKACGMRGNYEQLCRNLNIPFKEKENKIEVVAA